MQKQLEIGLNSGTIIYAPIPDSFSEEEVNDIIAQILYTDGYVYLSAVLDVSKNYYVKKSCIEYLTVNDETPKKPLME